MAKGHHNKGFTLIELLVVIAIIGLLISVLVPALKKAKDHAKKAVCLSNIRQMGFANLLYAEENDSKFIYNWFQGRDENGWPIYWCVDETFLTMLGMRPDEISNSKKSPNLLQDQEFWGAQWPKRFLCPSFKYFKNAWAHKVSYGYNIGATSSTYSISDIRGQASSKLMFADAQCWWLWKPGADYKKYWDRFGEETFSRNNYGETYYRHKEGANIAFFDGHVDNMAKEEVYHYAADGSLGDDARNNLLWYITSK